MTEQPPILRHHLEEDPEQLQHSQEETTLPDLPVMDPTKNQRESERLVLFTLRAIYLGLLLAVTVIIFLGDSTSKQQVISQGQWTAVIGVVAFGALIIAFDILTPDKKLASIFSIFLGLLAGLLSTVAVGALLDLVALSWNLDNESTAIFIQLIKIAIGITLIYLCISIVLTTKDSFRLVVPYIEFTKQSRGSRPLVLDSSALIDARIEPLVSTGMLEAPMVVPEFVLIELQALADSDEPLKRNKGRRGLAVVGRLRRQPLAELSVNTNDMPVTGVDRKIIELALSSQYRIVTTDYNLEKLAEIKGIPVLNLNSLAHSMRPQAIPGQKMQLAVVRVGEEPSQGIGYLPDGTMVVIEGAGDQVGQSIMVDVSNTLQTSVGRMVFAEYESGIQEQPGPKKEKSSNGPASEQHRQQPTQPTRRRGPSGRNPRR